MKGDGSAIFKEQSMNDLRYERKFFVSELTSHEIESIVKLHPAMFSEIFHERFINNIYFDSLYLRNFFDTVDGTAQRLKIRIRWYGELYGLIDKPVLEFKIKNGLTGRKEAFLLRPFEFEKADCGKTISQIFDESDIPGIHKLKLKTVEPMLLNRYKRRYFQSSDKKYRITIDTNLSFFRIRRSYNSFLHKLTDNRSIILELKYGSEMDNAASDITSIFPFRLTKSSKYVIGIEKLYGN
jgi:SPX domain protein involved in polyphosphate accumulation